MVTKWVNDIKIGRAFARYPEAVAQAMAQGLYIEAEHIMGDAKEIVPVDQSALKNSGYVDLPKVEGRRVVVELGFGGPAAPYAIHVHEGTRPRIQTGAKPPPIGPLKEWARRVLRDESLAYAVQRKIVMRGTEPTKYLETPYNARLQGFSQRMAERVRRRLAQEMAK
jgi:hypothetical protein